MMMIVHSYSETCVQWNLFIPATRKRGCITGGDWIAECTFNCKAMHDAKFCGWNREVAGLKGVVIDKK